MAKCDVCGNEYDKTVTVNYQGGTYTFDSFECAIHKLAPTCANCGVTIVGHGVEAGGAYYCSAHCAGQQGVSNAKDRVE